ncbi:MAG: quinone oxidoreductase [Pseudomonadota bacterium]|nr:quinone oxidoreductase [Pseudomonadota bacterium]
MTIQVRAIRVHETGGPEVLRPETIAIPEPGPGEARVRHGAVGLNFIDTYFRSGLYKAPALPFTPGNEGAGVVEAVGEGVRLVRPGDRVAYTASLGSYAEARNLAADRLVKLPDAVGDALAASVMLKGLTAWYLLRRTFPVGPEHTVLIHAAAGGVGQIAVQWAKALGAVVIGTAGGPEKTARARELGCDHAIDYRSESFVDRVRQITGGRGCDVVYDSVGRDAFPGSLDCLKPLGLWVSFGQSSGALPPVDTQLLSQKGSLFMTRPTLFTYIARREDLEAGAAELFGLIADGTLKAAVNQTWPLAAAAEAHRALEGRRTTGASVLLP